MSGGGHHGLAGGHGELVLYRSAGHLGDGVTVLNLHRDLLDLRVVHTVLSGDLTASMLHSSSDGVSHSMSNGSRGDMVSHSNGSSMVSNSQGSSSIASVMADSKGSSETVMSISISFSLSLSLPLMVTSVSNRSGSI